MSSDAQEGEYRLIVAANRDEYYRRPSQNAKIDEKGIIGGKDMEEGREGGMWLGVTVKEFAGNKKYCFAALVNITGEKLNETGGRGIIVSNYLNSTGTCEEYIKDLENTKTTFNGYNFIAIELSKKSGIVYHHSNTPTITSLYSGKQILGFGNSPVNLPLTKVTKGRKQFANIINKSKPKSELLEELLAFLNSEGQHLPDEELQTRQPAVYPFLSSIFVKIEDAGYGTRAQSIVFIDYDWNLEFIENTLEQPINIKNPKWLETVIRSKI